MTVIGPIVVKNGTAPAKRPHRGKTTDKTPVYAVIHTMKPRDYFECPNTRKLTPKQADQFKQTVRNWLREHEYDDSIEVYEADGGGVWVKYREQA